MSASSADELTSTPPEHILLGMGNPLLDCLIIVDKQFLEKYGLKENDAILADAKHLQIFEEISKRDDVMYIPGGATQNSLRVFEWVIGAPNRASFFGAVGVDEFSDRLAKLATDDGVNVRYQYNKEVHTGKCACLIYKEHRSLIADLAAANTFTIDHLDVKENMELVTKAAYYYISGFFLTVCPQAVMKVAKIAADNNKCLLMNLAAPFICSSFTDSLKDVLPFVDVLFCNEEEARAFAKALGWELQSRAEIAKKLSAYKKMTSTKRAVIITKGPDAIVYAKDTDFVYFPVECVPDDEIVDTNGAGDAFVGGFLAAFVKGHSTNKCLECGRHAAKTVIKHHGCQLPPKCDYEL